MRVVMVGESLSCPGGIASVEKLILRQRTPGITIRHIASLSQGCLAKKLVVFAGAATALAWLLFRNRAQLVHLHVSDRGSAFRQAILTGIASFFKTPVLIHAHSSTFDVFYAALPGFLRTVVRCAFQRAAKVLVVSKSWRDFYIQNLGLRYDKVAVLLNPVHLPATVPDRRDRTQVQILCLGRIGQRKGSFDLIHAFARLPKSQRERARLLLAGDGKVDEARVLAQQLGLSNAVLVLGLVDTLQRDQLLASSDVFVLPSYAEGLPMALLEAMGWRLPVVTTPVGGIGEVVSDGNNGLLVAPGDVEALTHALGTLIQQESLRFSLGRSARQSVERLDITHYMDLLSTIYLSLTPRSMLDLSADPAPTTPSN